MSKLYHLAKRVDTLFSVVSPRQNSPASNSGVFFYTIAANGEHIMSAEDQARLQDREKRGLGCVLLPKKGTLV